MSLFDDDVSGSVFVLLEAREILADARLGSETPRVFQGIDAIVLDEAHDFTAAMPDICACVLDCSANIPSVPHAYSLEVHLRGLWMRY